MKDMTNKLDKISLDFDEHQESALNRMLTIKQQIQEDSLQNYFDECCLPVQDGTLKVFHHKPDNPLTDKKILFVAGWGATLESFQDFYRSIINNVEIYHIESREKNSSNIRISKKNMSVSQNAQDVSDIIRYLKLNDPSGYLVGGACWGSSILLQGLIDHILPDTIYVLFDPMHSLWFPKWLLKGIIPYVPVRLANLIKPIGKAIALYGMQEKVQRRRAGDFIDNSDLRKWKAAAIQAGDFELIGNLSKINREVVIANGTKDKIHDQRYYPLIAGEIPNGSFLFMKTDESKRELLMGRTLLEFACNHSNNTVPKSLKIFEKSV